MAKNLGTFKQGDYFEFYADMPDYKGLLEDVKCQVRKSTGELIADMKVVKSADVEGRYLFSAGNVDWDTGTYVSDIQTSENGRLASSETFTIKVIKDVTK